MQSESSSIAKELRLRFPCSMTIEWIILSSKGSSAWYPECRCMLIAVSLIGSLLMDEEFGRVSVKYDLQCPRRTLVMPSQR